YDALATQLAISLDDITADRLVTLLRARQTLRRSLVSNFEGSGLALVDERFAAPTLDVEENYLVIAPYGAIPSNDCAVTVGHTNRGTIYKMRKRGTVELLI